MATNKNAKSATAKLTPEQRAALKKGGKIAAPNFGEALGNALTGKAGVKKAVALPKATAAITTANGKLPKAKSVKADKAALPKASGKGFAAAPAKAKVKAADVLRYKGAVIPLTRKPGEDDTSVPTLQVKTISDTMKLFEKLPKGCSWGGDGSNDTINIFNAKGMLICELRTTRK